MNEKNIFDGINIGKAKIINPFDRLKNELLEIKVYLIEEVHKNGNDKFNVIADIDMVDHSISQLDEIKDMIDRISKKYGWDK
jgi:GTP1/Obg family GTP-binding protein